MTTLSEAKMPSLKDKIEAAKVITPSKPSKVKRVVKKVLGSIKKKK